MEKAREKFLKTSLGIRLSCMSSKLNTIRDNQYVVSESAKLKQSKGIINKGERQIEK